MFVLWCCAITGGAATLRVQSFVSCTEDLRPRG